MMSGFFTPFEKGCNCGPAASYSISKITDSITGEVSYELIRTVENQSQVVGDIISFSGDGMLVNYGGELVLLDSAIADIENQLDKTYNFTTFSELNIDTHNKTLVEITNELIAKNLPTNTIITGQIYSQALPFSGNGEAEVLVNHPAYWWKCGSLNIEPYSWTAITASSSWGDNGLVMDWIPSNYSLPTASDSTLGGIKVGEGLTIDNSGVLFATEVAVSSSSPTDGEKIWIDPSSISTQNIPEIKDNLINLTDTWSSTKINRELSAIREMCFPTLTISVESGSSLTITDGIDTITNTAINGEFKTSLPRLGLWTITGQLNTKTVFQTIDVNLIKNYNVSLTYTYIYGVEWDFTDSSLARTDDAALFVDPVPFVNDGNTVGSSPFDNLYPWNGMVKETIDGNVLVKIPKFWYKIERTASSFSLKIANMPTTGFSISPAHRARGGYPEQNYVYIGRYHCDDNYKSTSGSIPKSLITRDAGRTNTHSIGADYYQFDISLLTTIWYLYLVEFANWDSQNKIGYGCGNGSSKEKSGSTDAMPYHTGTIQTSRTTYGVGIQYRYIEDLWANVLDWCDGIIFSNTDIYLIDNPANYSDSSSSQYAVLVGTRTSTSNYIQDFTNSSVSGFEWFMYPSTNQTGSNQNKVTDYCSFNASGVVLCVGGSFADQGAYRGLFCLSGSSAASSSYGGIGVRLMRFGQPIQTI